MEETGVQDGTRPAEAAHGRRAAEATSGRVMQGHRGTGRPVRPPGQDLAGQDLTRQGLAGQDLDATAGDADEQSPNVAISAGPDPAPEADLVRLALHKILTSPEFASADQLRAFLRYVVEAAVNAQGQGPGHGNGQGHGLGQGAGQGHGQGPGQTVALKGYTIATEALGRGADFNPTTDPIVRVEAARLRKRLQEYYAGTGRDDPIRIDIPKGSYAPQFVLPLSEQPVDERAEEPTQAAAPGIRGAARRGEERGPFRPLGRPSAVPGTGWTQAAADRSSSMTLARLLSERPDLVGVVAVVSFAAGLVIGRF
ncbi:hypothetical protein [Pannonibacter sp.]|uniref:hypothetical protein n=1 Tax=Pannonibacter sp. TaxID=1906786 RepID=UPI003F6EF020